MLQIDPCGPKTESQIPEIESQRPKIDSLKPLSTPRDPTLTPDSQTESLGAKDRFPETKKHLETLNVLKEDKN